MDILFFVLALVGAVMAFGTAVVRLFLEGVSLINFVSVADAVVYGVMLLMLLANVGWWVYTTRRSRHAKIRRYVSMLIMCLVALGYLVLLTSIWADAWLVSYVDWCASYHTVLTVLRIMGWLLMMAALGWFTHKSYVAMTTNGAHKVGSGSEPLPTEEPVADVAPKGMPDWLVHMEGGSEEEDLESPEPIDETTTSHDTAGDASDKVTLVEGTSGS